MDCFDGRKCDDGQRENMTGLNGFEQDREGGCLLYRIQFCTYTWSLRTQNNDGTYTLLLICHLTTFTNLETYYFGIVTVWIRTIRIAQSILS
jgi:hypothetical protein